MRPFEVRMHMDFTRLPCPLRTLTCLLVSGSQTRALRSVLLVASRVRPLTGTAQTQLSQP
ncbi:hypothetical protein ACZ90_35675 [Streptomyces albus subsp. albus]|nr:hypothetical protein ACZ90_35675 [Streptomyces albus subsp. albus]